MRNLVRLIAISFLTAAPAAARDIYVNNTGGDDRFTGQQPIIVSDTTGPVQSIAKALRLAQAGDHIVLADTGRPYRESITLEGSRRSSLYKQPLVIEGNGAVMDGSAPVPRDGWKNYREGVFRFRPPQGVYQQLFLDGKPAVRVAASPLSASPPKLEPREWCLHQGHIYFCVEPTKLPQDYNLRYAHLQTGVTLFHVDGVTIRELTVQGYQLDGINAQNSARRVVLSDVACKSNGRAGIVVGGASQMELDACQLGGNGQAQLLTQPQSETHIYASELLGDTAPAWTDQGGRLYLGEAPLRGGRERIKPEEAKRKPGDKRPPAKEAEKPSPEAEKPSPEPPAEGEKP